MVKLCISVIIPLACFSRLCYTDIKTRELENIFILLLLPCAFLTEPGAAARLAGLFLPFILMGLYGFGDIMLLAVLGFIFGIGKLCFIYCTAAASAGIYCIAALAAKRVNKKSSIAFAPFIFLGCLLLMSYNIFFS